MPDWEVLLGDVTLLQAVLWIVAAVVFIGVVVKLLLAGGDDAAVLKAIEDMQEDLQASFERQFQDFGAALRAEVLAGLPAAVSGASAEDVDRIVGEKFDKAFGSLQLGVIPARAQ